jgi:hypothetical protein
MCNIVLICRCCMICIYIIMYPWTSQNLGFGVVPFLMCISKGIGCIGVYRCVYIYTVYTVYIYIQYIHMFIEFLNPGRQKPRDKNQPQKSSNSFIEPQWGILSLVFFGRILGKNEPQNASNYLKLAQTALKIIRTASNCWIFNFGRCWPLILHPRGL